MTKVEQYSKIEMYGNKELFAKRQSEGFTEVAFGSGDWVDSERIVAIWAFYNQQGNTIATYEHPKSDDGCHTVRGLPFEATYTPKEFEARCAERRIKMGSRHNLAELVKKLEENNDK